VKRSTCLQIISKFFELFFKGVDAKIVGSGAPIFLSSESLITPTL
jgi:hypothetical protein